MMTLKYEDNEIFTWIQTLKASVECFHLSKGVSWWFKHMSWGYIVGSWYTSHHHIQLSCPISSIKMTCTAPPAQPSEGADDTDVMHCLFHCQIFTFYLINCNDPGLSSVIIIKQSFTTTTSLHPALLISHFNYSHQLLLCPLWLRSYSKS